MLCIKRMMGSALGSCTWKPLVWLEMWITAEVFFLALFHDIRQLMGMCAAFNEWLINWLSKDYTSISSWSSSSCCITPLKCQRMHTGNILLSKIFSRHFIFCALWTVLPQALSYSETTRAPFYSERYCPRFKSHPGTVVKCHQCKALFYSEKCLPDHDICCGSY